MVRKYGDVSEMIVYDNRSYYVHNIKEVMYDINRGKIHEGVIIPYYVNENKINIGDEIIVEISIKKLERHVVKDIKWNMKDNSVIKKGEEFEAYERKWYVEDNPHFAKEFDENALYCIKTFEPRYVCAGIRDVWPYQIFHFKK
jgi:sporulation protein YlmC with PRC-barrel domain